MGSGPALAGLLLVAPVVAAYMDAVAQGARAATFDNDGTLWAEKPLYFQLMLQWTTAGQGARFALLVQHTDAEREWAYDKDSSVGRLDKALTEANAKGWTVVDMKRDWKVVYPPEKR